MISNKHVKNIVMRKPFTNWEHVEVKKNSFLINCNMKLGEGFHHKSEKELHSPVWFVDAIEISNPVTILNEQIPHQTVKILETLVSKEEEKEWVSIKTTSAAEGGATPRQWSCWITLVLSRGKNCITFTVVKHCVMNRVRRLAVEKLSYLKARSYLSTND